MTARKRNRKLAEAAEIAYGVFYGVTAFDDRLEEMGPGISARGTGPGTKGGSSPTEAQAAKPPVVVTSHLDRLIDVFHAAALDVDAAYGEIARVQRGVPTKGDPSCAWCAEAVQAAAKVAAVELAKARAKGDNQVSLGDLSPVPLDYRSPTYLYAEVRKGDKVISRQLVCEWCYRVNLRTQKKPSMEERWVHAQGGRMPKVPRMKAAPRVKAS